MLKELVNPSLNRRIEKTIEVCEKHEILTSDEGVLVRVGPDKPGGIMFAGHIDTVSAGQEPCLKRKNGRLYGIGTSDMLGAIANYFKFMEEVDTSTLERPVYFSITTDEETNFRDVHYNMRELNRRQIRPMVCFLGEPTEMKVVRCHMGFWHRRVNVFGKSCHASKPELGVNAIYDAVDLIQEIRSKVDVGASGSYSIGVIGGGEKSNIVPEYCHFQIDVRSMNDDLISKIDNIIQGFRGASEIQNIATLNHPNFVSSFTTEGETQSYTTEAGVYEQYGVPTVVIGPGDPNCIHSPDEYIDEKLWNQHMDFVRAKVVEYCT